jgi:hypothetical protein
MRAVIVEQHSMAGLAGRLIDVFGDVVGRSAA